MQEDSITLKFSTTEPINFALGNWLNYERNGQHIKRYELTDIATPRPNKTTGGYDYELKLDAYYWKWKNKILKYQADDASPKEIAWSMTATPDIILGVLLRNLEDYGYRYYGGNKAYTFDLSTLEKATESKAVSFDNTNILDALNIIAEAWECEWWVTENIIHLGKCEFGDTYVPLHTTAYNGDRANVDEMSQSGNRATYATRIYAYGAERNIPNNYRSTDNDDTLSAVVQKRLMLPVGTPYIDAYKYNSNYTQRIYIGESGYDTAPNAMPEEEAVEDGIVLDHVYPKVDDTIKAVETTTITDSTINEEGTTEVESWTRYRIQLTSSESVRTWFKTAYILPGMTLRISFESGLLNGMDFDVKFNPEAANEADIESQWFEIVRNEDYGRNLPNGFLKPAKEDKVVLYNWDIAVMATDELSHISRAEQDLYKEAVKVIKKTMVDPNNYNCKMMSDIMLGYDCNTGVTDTNKALSLEIGQRVMLINPAYFEEGMRKSRVLGYEYELDCPWDNPTYTIGETATVGRLAQIETKLSQVDAKAEKMSIRSTSSSTGGGNVIYVIGSNDSTQASDTNVYSAKRTNNSFARKDINDTIEEIWSFYKHLQSNGFNSGVLGNGWYLGYNHFNEKGEGTNSHLEVDTLKIRKKAMFDSLEIKHISHVGGELILSPAGATISKVVEGGQIYRCYFRNSDGTDATTNQFAVGDLIMCKTFNINGRQRYYWRRCMSKGTSTDGMAYVDLSKTMYDTTTTNAVPEEGDAIVVVGNDTDSARSNAIDISSYATGAPIISLYQGINTFELTESKMPVRISPTLGNKFTGEFYIQVLADDGTQQVMSLAEFTEQRISLGVNERLYGDNAIGDNMVAFPTEVLAGSGIYSRTYAVNQKVASTWKAGDEVVFSFVFMPIELTSSLTIGGGGVLGYMFDVIDLSDEIRDGMSTLSGRMTCKMTLAQAQALAEENEDDDRSLSVIISARGLHEQGELTLANGYSAELKRTGVDIERGYIALDAHTTAIKDGDKELAIFTTNEQGKAVLSTELIDADAIEANRLSTKGRTGEDGKKVDFIHVEQNQMSVFDSVGDLKVKVHCGNLSSDSSSDSIRSYNNVSSVLAQQSYGLTLALTEQFRVSNVNRLYKFANVTGTISFVPRTSSSPNEFGGSLTPSVDVKVQLYYSEHNTADISEMTLLGTLAKYHTEWSESATSTQYITFNMSIDSRTLANGFYRVGVVISTSTLHADSSVVLDGNDNGVTGVLVTKCQEIASNGYHYQYGDANMPVYQKGNASDGFVMMYDKKGIKVDGSGAWFKQGGDDWSLIGSGGGGGDTPSVVVPSISINATATETSSTGTPKVKVTKTGSDTAPSFAFAFENLKGDKGDTGATGSKGDKGDKGDQGIPGVKGDTGVGISSIDVDYAQMGINDTPNASTSWNPTMPRPEAGKVIWTRFKITKTDLTTTTAYTKAYQGKDGESQEIGNNIHIPRFRGVTTRTDVTLKTGTSMMSESYSKIYYFSALKIFAYAEFFTNGVNAYPYFSVEKSTYQDYQDITAQEIQIHKDKLFLVDGTNEIYCWQDDKNGLVLVGGGNAPTKTSELTNDSGFITANDNVVSATKLQTVRYINGSPFDGTTNVVSYAVCTTAASTTAKTVSISRFSLATGSQVRVKFSNPNTASAPTLNVGYTGAKRMSYKGKLITNTNFTFNVNKIYTFTYDGTNWVLEGDWDEIPKTNYLSCAFIGEVGDVIWSYDTTNQITLIHNWMNALSEGKVCVLDSDDDIYTITYALNYSSDETYGSDKARFSYIFDGYLYEVEYDAVALPVTLTIVSKTKIGGSNAEVGVMPKGDSTGEYVPIVANFTNIYSPASAPSTAQYYTRNGEYINEAYGGLAYITYNNIVVSQVIPLNVGGVTLYPVMIAEAISKENNNYTAWEQCYVTIALIDKNPVIKNIFNSSKTQISPSILSRCVLKSVVLGSFRK